jgi:PAS domain S-box-containing protein
MATASSTEQLIYVAGLEATESKQSEQRYRAIVEGLQEGILLYENGIIRLCNPSAEKLLGCPTDQLIGQTEWKIATLHEEGFPLPPESHPVAISLRTKEARKGNIIGIRKEEGLVWLSTNTCPLRLQDTTEYDALVLSLTDISDRKALEDELRDKVILFSSLFEMTTIGIAILDEDGRFLRVNQAYCQLYGYPPHELIGQLFTILLPPPLRKEAFLHYTDFSSAAITHSWPMQHHDGHLITHQMFESKMVLPDKRQVRVTYVIPPQEEASHSELFPSKEWFSLLKWTCDICRRATFI